MMRILQLKIADRLSSSKKCQYYYLVASNAMSERQSGSDSGKVSLLEVPVVFGVGEGFRRASKRLHRGFFIHVLSPAIDSN